MFCPAWTRSPPAPGSSSLEQTSKAEQGLPLPDEVPDGGVGVHLTAGREPLWESSWIKLSICPVNQPAEKKTERKCYQHQNFQNKTTKWIVNGVILSHRRGKKTKRIILSTLSSILGGERQAQVKPYFVTPVLTYMDASSCRFGKVWFFYSNPKYPDFKSQPRSEIKELPWISKWRSWNCYFTYRVWDCISAPTVELQTPSGLKALAAISLSNYVLFLTLLLFSTGTMCTSIFMSDLHWPLVVGV